MDEVKEREYMLGVWMHSATEMQFKNQNYVTTNESTRWLILLLFFSTIF